MTVQSGEGLQNKQQKLQTGSGYMITGRLSLRYVVKT